MSEIKFTGIDRTQLTQTLAKRIDHGGNPIEPFVDSKGGMPMRCCLADSVAGDEVAIIAWSPFPWQGAYCETGPIYVHTKGCPGLATTEALPPELDVRQMTLRPYGPDKMIAYHLVRHVDEGESLTDHVQNLFDEFDIDLLHGRNATGGCYSFTASRAELDQ
jgi:hypothetical protein